MTSNGKPWEAPRIRGGADAGPVIDGLRALRAAQDAVEEAARRLDEAAVVFAEADIADVAGMVEMTTIALHSTVRRRVAAALFALKQMETLPVEAAAVAATFSRDGSG